MFSITTTKTFGAMGAGVWVGDGVGNGVAGRSLCDGDGVVAVEAGGATHDTARARTSASFARGRIGVSIVRPTRPNPFIQSKAAKIEGQVSNTTS